MLDPGELYLKHPYGRVRAVAWLCSVITLRLIYTASVPATIYSNLMAEKISTETAMT